MLPIDPQPAPPDFADKVATPGNAWLTDKRLDPALPLPPATVPPPYWRACLPQLHERYRGICAYLAVHIERAAGGVTVDHFVAKSSLAGHTYDWRNYRLACSMMNARKRAFDDVLDPFELPRDVEVFHLELVSGRLFVNPSLPSPLADQGATTLARLRLDDGVSRAMRARHFGDYASGDISLNILRRDSPFVHAEALRQGLL